MEYSRIKRNKITQEEMGILSKGGITDLFDNQMKTTFRITDDEYDFLAENLPDNDGTNSLIFKENLNFSEKRKILCLLKGIFSKLDI